MVIFCCIVSEVGSMKNASRLFHSLLYTYILRNDLTTAISFVDSLIVKANPDMEFEFDPDQKMSRHNLQPSFLTFVTSTLRSRVIRCIFFGLFFFFVSQFAHFNLGKVSDFIEPSCA